MPLDAKPGPELVTEWTRMAASAIASDNQRHHYDADVQGASGPVTRIFPAEDGTTGFVYVYADAGAR